MILIFSAFLLSYLLGSIPTAVWTGKLFFGIDVRTQGSGNAGATNTFRVLGKPAGTFVLLVDVLKGWASTSLAGLLFQFELFEENDLLFFKLVFGLVAVLGHIYPIFAGFNGGKGVATLLGMAFSISWPAGLICVGVFLVLFIIWHYVSVGSMVGGITFTVLMISGFCGHASNPAIVLSALLSIMVIYTHRGNLKKLRNGTENKMYFLKQKS
jgi:acyl phosphate:glycerol-3-phosphate acyltransferase